MKKLAIGIDDFKLLRKQGSFFVDKSFFIEQIIEDGSQVLLFPRTRHFGKTLNMSMLNYFFNHHNHNAEENRELFKDLKIEKTQAYEEHQGKYPVISMSMKEVKSKNYAGFKSKIQKLLSELYQQHEYLLGKDRLNVLDKKHFIVILEGKADTSILESSLKLDIPG